MFNIKLKIAAIATRAQGLGSCPDELWVHIAVADVVGFAEHLGKLRTTVFFAGFIIGTFQRICGKPIFAFFADKLESTVFSNIQYIY